VQVVVELGQSHGGVVQCATRMSPDAHRRDLSAPRPEPSCERGHLPFRPFVRVFTTATGVAPEWGGTDGVDLATGQ